MKDFEELDRAIAAAASDSPTTEQERELTIAHAKFERTVSLITDKNLRTLALECQSLTVKHAVTSQEPDEKAKGPNQQQVTAAQKAMMERIRDLSMAAG